MGRRGMAAGATMQRLSPHRRANSMYDAWSYNPKDERAWPAQQATPAIL